MKTKPKKRTSAKPAKPSCTLIQWGALAVNAKGKPICPECGDPAEMVLGVIGPCWAHK